VHFKALACTFLNDLYIGLFSWSGRGSCQAHIWHGSEVDECIYLGELARRTFSELFEFSLICRVYNSPIWSGGLKTSVADPAAAA
jgi:hypothetical protein